LALVLCVTASIEVGSPATTNSGTRLDGALLDHRDELRKVLGQFGGELLQPRGELGRKHHRGAGAGDEIDLAACEPPGTPASMSVMSAGRA
jgi:hypothetical protein